MGQIHLRTGPIHLPTGRSQLPKPVRFSVEVELLGNFDIVLYNDICCTQLARFCRASWDTPTYLRSISKLTLVHLGEEGYSVLSQEW